MAIEYVEIRDTNRVFIGIIDTAISIIWHSVYYGVGDFEIYAQATEKHLALLAQDYFVTRPDNNEVGIIENIHITRTAQDGDVIVASGRFAKSILDRRIIYNYSNNENNPFILSGKVEENVRNLVNKNAIACPFDSKRDIAILSLGNLADIPTVITDESGKATQIQVSCKNLMNYTDELLKQYGLSARVTLNDDSKMLEYGVFEGTDRSAEVIFSQDFDNLIQSDYEHDTSTERNIAFVGGEGEGIARFFSLVGDKQGIERREIFVDASDINKDYLDEQNIEKQYTDEEYKKMLDAEGKQSISVNTAIDIFTGSINATFGNWILNEDYFLGDIVTLQDNRLGKYAAVRITEVTEVQDENGYSIDAKYE